MKPLVSIAALPLAFIFIGPALAQAPLPLCNIAGSKTIMGDNVTADFDVQAQGCMSDILPHGTLTSTEISRRPEHGTVTMVDKDTWTYVPKSGYVGPDSFAITAKGQSINERPGTSVLTYRATVR